jgi:hypothetical protein
MPSTISDRIIKYCTETKSVSDLLEADPSRTPEHAMKELFGTEHNYIGEAEATHSSKAKTKATGSKSSTSSEVSLNVPIPTDEDLERVLKCGKFGDVKPSKLFLQMLHDALLTLDHDPLAGVISPSLMASTGVLPMTVIGPVWDICRHMVSELI